MIPVLQNCANPVDTQTALPLVVDLDDTLLKVDTLYELIVLGLFTKPVQTLLSLFALRNGIAEFKRRLSNIAKLDVEGLPFRYELLDYLKRESAAGRELHLATAADREVAIGIAERFPIFKTVL